MSQRVVISPDLLGLARRQAGVLSAGQLHGFGVSDKVIGRLAKEGTLVSRARGVYALWPGDWAQSAWGAVLVGGPYAVLGGSAAAHLHGLVAAPPVIDCYCPAGSRCQDGSWRFIRAERRGYGEPPRTRLAQTVIDASRTMDADEIAAMLARSGRDLPHREVLRILEATGRHPQRALLQEILGDVTAGAQSALEVRYARDVERRHGLPAARRQAYPSLAKVDVYYDDYHLIVELDGRRWHGGLAAWGDAARDNEHLSRGVVTMRFTWREVTKNPCQVARRVAQVLHRCGWRGELTACRRCLAS